MGKRTIVLLTIAQSVHRSYRSFACTIQHTICKYLQGNMSRERLRAFKSTEIFAASCSLDRGWCCPRNQKAFDYSTLVMRTILRRNRTTVAFPICYHVGKQCASLKIQNVRPSKPNNHRKTNLPRRPTSARNAS